MKVNVEQQLAVKLTTVEAFTLAELLTCVLDMDVTDDPYEVDLMCDLVEKIAEVL